MLLYDELSLGARKGFVLRFTRQNSSLNSRQNRWSWTAKLTHFENYLSICSFSCILMIFYQNFLMHIPTPSTDNESYTLRRSTWLANKIEVAV